MCKMMYHLHTITLRREGYLQLADAEIKMKIIYIYIYIYNITERTITNQGIIVEYNFIVCLKDVCIN